MCVLCVYERARLKIAFFQAIKLFSRKFLCKSKNMRLKIIGRRMSQQHIFVNWVILLSAWCDRKIHICVPSCTSFVLMLSISMICIWYGTPNVVDYIVWWYSWLFQTKKKNNKPTLENFASMFSCITNFFLFVRLFIYLCVPDAHNRRIGGIIIYSVGPHSDNTLIIIDHEKSHVFVPYLNRIEWNRFETIKW